MTRGHWVGESLGGKLRHCCVVVRVAAYTELMVSPGVMLVARINSQRPQFVSWFFWMRVPSTRTLPLLYAVYTVCRSSGPAWSGPFPSCKSVETWEFVDV